jgi:ribonuclease Z
VNKVVLTILGSAAGMPQADRVNAGLVLAVDKRLILLDCGGGVSSAFRRNWFDPLAVERVIITHTHPDHISDLPLFVQMLYLADRRAPFVIHVPSEVLMAVQDYFQALYLLREKLPFEIEFLPIPKEIDIHAEGVAIHPIPNTHLQGYRQLIDEYRLSNKMQCYSLLITVANKTILYSADLGSEKDVIPHLRNLDLLVIESTHIDIERLFAAALENKVRRVVLTHLTETYDGEAALLAARKAGLDNVMLAMDGLRIEI